MDKKEALKELSSARVLILTDVKRFHEARQIAIEVMKKEIAEEEKECSKES